MLTLEEIYDEYKYGNYSDNHKRVCCDVGDYITNNYGLNLRHARMVASGVYDAKKDNMKEFFDSIDFAAKIAVNIRNNMREAISDALEVVLET